MSAIKPWLGTIAAVIIVLLICGMAMHVTGDDNTCTDAGGHLEFSNQRWSGEVCMRDGQVIEP